MQTLGSTTIGFVSVSKSVRLNGADFYDVTSMLSRLWCYFSFCTYLQKLQSCYWPECRWNTPNSVSITSVTRSLVRTSLSFVMVPSHIQALYRCIKHYFHYNCPWFTTCHCPIIRPHIHIPWWGCPEDRSYDCVGTLYVTLSTDRLYSCGDLTVCYHADIFELTYRSSMRPEILIHHFCVCLFSDFHYSL
jgi:hypothetical protein